MTVREDGAIRVSDDDRERAVARLRDHHAAGRLTLEEFTERVGEAYAARTDLDLARVFRELPPEPVPDSTPPPPPPPRTDRARWRYALARFGVVNGVCIGVWAASGAHDFWPMWVLIPTGLVLVRRTSHRHDVHRRPMMCGGTVEGAPAGPGTDRVVMSVLFVDIVNSTGHAAALGDDAWGGLVADYSRRVRALVRQVGGEVLFTKGDEVVAGFATPAAAIGCARAIRQQARDRGFDVRAGLHAGEVERRGDEANGLAMHIGQRVCDQADPGRLLVSSTVRDLLVGSSIAFTDAGERALKGLPGTWRLYEVAG